MKSYTYNTIVITLKGVVFDMEFLVDKNFCPYHIQYKFMWFTKMKDGSYIYEYDDRREPHWTDPYKDQYMEFIRDSCLTYAENKKYQLATVIKDISLFMLKDVLNLVGPDHNNGIQENLYDNLPKQDVQQLGLLGCGQRIYFDTDTGVFDINGSLMELAIELDGKKYNLSGDHPFIEYTDLHERHEMMYSFSLGGGSSAGNLAAMTIGYAGKIINQDLNVKFDILYSITSKYQHVLRLLLKPNKEIDGYISMIRPSGISAEKVELKPNQLNEFSILITS